MRGNAALIEEFVRPFVADRDARLVGCWALTEPDHGSDRFQVGTPEFFDPKITGQVIARRDGESYVINGKRPLDFQRYHRDTRCDLSHARSG